MGRMLLEHGRLGPRQGPSRAARRGCLNETRPAPVYKTRLCPVSSYVGRFLLSPSPKSFRLCRASELCQRLANLSARSRIRNAAPARSVRYVAGPAIGATPMAQILPFVSRCNVFNPDATLAMGEAYDRAISTNPDAESQFVVRELIAKRIVRMALKGVVDRDQLCTSAAQTTILFGVSALDRA